MIRLALVFLFVFVAMLVAAPIVYAAGLLQTIPAIPANPDEFVIWLGSAVAAGFVVSYGLERLPWFQSSPNKPALIFGVFVALPFVSQLLGWAIAATPVFPATPQDWVRWVIALGLQGGLAWAASQYAHANDPKALKKAKSQ